MYRVHRAPSDKTRYLGWKHRAALRGMRLVFVKISLRYAVRNAELALDFSVEME